MIFDGIIFYVKKALIKEMSSLNKDISFIKQNFIAHRGVYNNVEIVENSMEAFKEAIKRKYIIELDVHLLKDNKTIVVYHDDNLERLTKINKKIVDCSYDELCKIKLFGKDIKIPTIEEVLKLVDGKVPIIIELKYDRKVGLLESRLANVLDNYNGKFAVKSFNPLSIMWFKRHRKNYVRGLLVNYSHNNLKEYIISKMLFLKETTPDFLSVSYEFANSDKIQKLRLKMPVIAWTVKDKKTYEKVKNSFDNLILENFDNVIDNIK